MEEDFDIHNCHCNYCWNNFAVKLNSKTKITAKEVTNFNYFITTIDGKSGVIDKKGNVVINNEYDYVQIPNPEKPVFICLYDYNTETMEYSSKVLNENKKEILSKYEKVQAIPNNNTSISNPYQTEILQYKSNGKYGLITLSGSKITDAIYDSIETLEYKDGILKVKKRWTIWTYRFKWKRNRGMRIFINYNRWILQHYIKI